MDKKALDIEATRLVDMCRACRLGKLQSNVDYNLDNSRTQCIAELAKSLTAARTLTGERPDDREPVDAVKAGYSYLRANGVRYGGGPTVYSEHGQMISDLLDYIQRLRGVIHEANTRLRHPDSGSTSVYGGPSTELDLRPSEVIVREQRDAWPDRQKP